MKRLSIHCYLDEKRIEREDINPKVSIYDMLTRWKEDWKIYTPPCTSTVFLSMTRWKEDWKRIALTSSPASIPILLDEKRIERYLHFQILLHLNVLTRWKEDWKLYTSWWTAIPTYSLSRWKEDWKGNIPTKFAHSMLMLDEKRIESCWNAYINVIKVIPSNSMKRGLKAYNSWNL